MRGRFDPRSRIVEIVIRTEGRAERRAAAILMVPSAANLDCLRQELFAKIDMNLADAVQGKVMRRGRKRGAVSAKTAYVCELVNANPGKTAEELKTIALAEADRGATPFGDEDGELYDLARNRLLSDHAFANVVSRARAILRKR